MSASKTAKSIFMIYDDYRKNYKNKTTLHSISKARDVKVKNFEAKNNRKLQDSGFSSENSNNNSSKNINTRPHKKERELINNQVEPIQDHQITTREQMKIKITENLKIHKLNLYLLAKIMSEYVKRAESQRITAEFIEIFLDCYEKYDCQERNFSEKESKKEFAVVWTQNSVSSDDAGGISYPENLKSNSSDLTTKHSEEIDDIDKISLLESLFIWPNTCKKIFNLFKLDNTSTAVVKKVESNFDILLPAKANDDPKSFNPKKLTKWQRQSIYIGIKLASILKITDIFVKNPEKLLEKITLFSLADGRQSNLENLLQILPIFCTKIVLQYLDNCLIFESEQETLVYLTDHLLHEDSDLKDDMSYMNRQKFHVNQPQYFMGKSLRKFMNRLLDMVNLRILNSRDNENDDDDNHLFAEVDTDLTTFTSEKTINRTYRCSSDYADLGKLAKSQAPQVIKLDKISSEIKNNLKITKEKTDNSIDSFTKISKKKAKNLSTNLTRCKIFEFIQVSNLIYSTVNAYLRRLIYEYFEDQNLLRYNVLDLFEKCFDDMPEFDNENLFKLFDGLLHQIGDKYRDFYFAYKVYKLGRKKFGLGKNSDVFENQLVESFEFLSENGIAKIEKTDCLGKKNAEIDVVRIPDDVEKDMLFLDDANYDTDQSDFFEDFFKEPIIAIDTEFFSSVFERSQGTTALIQLATFDKLLILDAVKLSFDQISDVFSKICNKPIEVIGYGLDTDRKMFLHYIGEKLVKNIKWVEMVKIENFVIKNALLETRQILAYENSRKKGLSRLCVAVLGKPLSKIETQANWLKRPLRNSQIYYAGLDAYVLIQLYTKLEPILRANSDSFSKNGNLKLNVPKKLLTKKSIEKDKDEIKEEQDVIDLKINQNSSIINFMTFLCNNDPDKNHKFANRPNDYKFYILDNITGIGRQLRMLGCDIKLSNAKAIENLSAKVTEAFEENRVIIGSGRQMVEVRNILKRLIKCENARFKDNEDKTIKRFQKTIFSNSYYLPSNNVQNAKNMAKSESIKIIKNLKMQIFSEDIFSRCSKCNFLGFINIDYKHFTELCLRIITGRADYLRRKDLDPDGNHKVLDVKYNQQGGHFNRFLMTIFIKRIFSVFLEEDGDLSSAMDESINEITETLASIETKNNKKLLDFDSDSDDSDEDPNSNDNYPEDLQKIILSPLGDIFLDKCLIYPKKGLLEKNKQSNREFTIPLPNRGFFEYQATNPDESKKIDYMKLDINVIRPLLREQLKNAGPFKICPICGAVFWDGCHQENTLQNFSEILVDGDKMSQNVTCSESGSSIY